MGDVDPLKCVHSATLGCSRMDTLLWRSGSIDRKNLCDYQNLFEENLNYSFNKKKIKIQKYIRKLEIMSFSTI